MTSAINATSRRPWYLSATPLATLPWLIRLRWAITFVDAAVLLVALLLPHADFPLRRIAALIGLSAVANTAAAVYLSRGRSIPRAAVLAILVLDVALLTGLLELTGGPFNPFAVIYAVHIALAAVTLGRTSAVLVATGATACYGVLFYWHTLEGISGHHRINDFPTHLFTMWFAMSAVAELVAYFVVQASKALEAMRARAARSERIVSLTTLAAGAAHELSTPLATIALTARELEHSANRGASGALLVDDARLIRTEVDRCQAILDQMSGRAGGTAADDVEPVDVKATITEVIQELPRERASLVQLKAPDGIPRIHLSRAGFRQAVLSLIGNALDATPAEQSVAVDVDLIVDTQMLRVAVRDSGPGMPRDVLVRAGEPFFTTKEAGRGLGLGLFLARVFAERSGGSLTIESERGTTVMIVLPVQGTGLEAI